MPGTVAGGKAAAATNKKRYGKHFYAEIGAKGGRLGRTGGFHVARHDDGCGWSPRAHRVAECAGAKGGTISRRTPSK